MSADIGANSGSPVLAGFDPLAPEQAADPFGYLARARNDMPVFYVPKLDLWCMTRMEDVLAAFRDKETFSNSHEQVGLPPTEFADQIPDGHPVAHSLDALDPPQHTRIRKLAQKAFTPRQINSREGYLRDVCNRLIDAFVDRGQVDLVPAFTSHIPVRMITAIVGLGEEHAATAKQWTDDWFQIWLGEDPPDVRRERWQRAVDFDKFIRAFVEERREQPRDDFASNLVHARSDDGEPSLSTYEVICVIAGVIAAGTDTTSILIANAVWLLLTHPQIWERVKADRSLIEPVVEETLRLRNPVRGLRRVTKCPVEIGGARIDKGETMYVHIGSANRDETVFEHPDEFDIDRSELGEHIGFGKWTHFCLGAPLARMEARVGLECLIDRLPGLRLGEEEREGLQYTPNAVIPAVKNLRVCWD